MLPYIVNPYAKGQLSTLPADARKIDYAVLRELVFAAAVADHDGLVRARRAVAANPDPQLLRQFLSLPPNVATLDAMSDTARVLKDKSRLDQLRKEWAAFFREKYEAMVQNRR